MAQKPYKYNIEYIQRFYSYGSEAKAVEIQPKKKQAAKSRPPKREKESVKTICIDPIAFCGMMVAIVMLLVMVAGMLQYGAIQEDHQILESYVGNLREDSAFLQHQYNAGYDLESTATTARALGMIPVTEAKTIPMEVVVPEAPEEPGFFDNLVWFFSGLFA